MAIQVTPIPRLTVLTVPAFTLGTANAAGSAVTAVASDSTLLAFNSTLPDAITFGQSGDAGISSGLAAGRDHAHAMAASPTAAVFARVIRTAGNVTTTSTTLVDATGATVTLTTGAFPVRYSASQSAQNDTLNNQLRFNCDVDGTLMHGAGGLFHQQPVAGLVVPWSFSGQTAALSAASHTIKEQWSVNANTGTYLATSDNNHMWAVEEIK